MLQNDGAPYGSMAVIILIRFLEFRSEVFSEVVNNIFCIIGSRSIGRDAITM